MSVPRPHTGRKRNEQARRAVLDATARLMTSENDAPLTVEAIATEAGVGRQTLYRWWPSKGAIMLEALTETAGNRVPPPDTGSTRRDLEIFLLATVRQIREPTTSRTLRRLAREAAVDEHAAELLRAFVENRRSVLREMIGIGGGRDADLLVDQVYGAIWYRLLLGHRPLDDDMAASLASTLADGLGLGR